MMLSITQFKSPIGKLKLTASEKGLMSIEFAGTTKHDSSLILSLVIDELTLYFQGKLLNFKVPLDIKGTDFQKKCWKELQKIKYGQTISYKEQALFIGGANYARAVAGANNKNKIPIIIPCHRVIGSNGNLVGYAGGLVKKKFLLDLEK